MTRGARAACACGAALAIAVGLAASRDARAQDKPTAFVTVAAAPIFGTEAATGNGWNAIVARVDNPSTATQRGVLELSMASGFGSTELAVAARAPFVVPPGRTAMVTIPAHPFSSYYAPQVVLTAKSETGTKLESVNVSVSGAQNPLLVEIAQPPRLGAILRGWPIAIAPAGVAPVGTAGTQLTTGAPSVDRTTGDPVLPDRPGAYGPTTVVIAASDRVATLEEGKRDALIDWVRGGGTLALVVTRPEDLRAPWMTALVGGEAKTAAPPARLLTLPAYAKPQNGTGLEPPEPDDDDESPGATPGAPKEPRPKAIHSGPAPATIATLAGYEGGRLAASDDGAAARCGLGEVHLLAFDPFKSPAIDDPWAHSRLIDLVARAWNRRTRVALPAGGGERGTSRLDDVRRALDPNENFRLGLGISALLLVVYAIVVGPVIFLRAAKKGAPLAPLKWVPITSAAAFAAIVLVGFAIKGWRGRARHLTVLEAGSGEARASMRRYRGFFASETRSLSVPSSAPLSLLSVAAVDARNEAGVLGLDRDGATLTDLTSLPWQTVVVREDGMTDVGHGVVLRAAASGNVVVENHTGRVLKDVIVHAPGTGNAAYFTTIDDGEVVDLPRGRAIGAVGALTSSSSGAKVHALQAGAMEYMLGGRDGKRVSDTWQPIEVAAGDGIDWWPDDAPALIGELVGGPKPASDAGLGLESDRTLIRIVGEETP